jgi:predicted ATP-dependent protease
VVAAIASSVRNRVIPASTAMFGEVGLAGEVRGITQASLRVREAAQMGFSRCIMPEANIEPALEREPVRRAEDRDRPGGTPEDAALHRAGACDLIGVRTVGEALDFLMS